MEWFLVIFAFVAFLNLISYATICVKWPHIMPKIAMFAAFSLVLFIAVDIWARASDGKTANDNETMVITLLLVFVIILPMSHKWDWILGILGYISILFFLTMAFFNTWWGQVIVLLIGTIIGLVMMCTKSGNKILSFGVTFVTSTIFILFMRYVSSSHHHIEDVLPSSESEDASFSPGVWYVFIGLTIMFRVFLQWGRHRYGICKKKKKRTVDQLPTDEDQHNDAKFSISGTTDLLSSGSDNDNHKAVGKIIKNVGMRTLVEEKRNQQIKSTIIAKKEPDIENPKKHMLSPDEHKLP